MRVVVDDPFDARLLDRLQTDLPLVERPYAALAEALESDESHVIERVQALRDASVVRQVSAIFDTRRLGYKGMLVAARTSPEQQDMAAAVFSAHPGVTHNYEREHDFNLWFTLTVGPDSRIGLERSVELLGELAGVESIRPMPALRFFKIGVDLDVKGGRDPAAKAARKVPQRPAPAPESLSEREIRAIRALQLDLPAVAEPFRAAAEAHGFTVPELLAQGHAFLETGQMRRFAAVLAHRKAGFVQNGMGVWIVPEEQMDEMGQAMAAFRGVSHCYQRPTYPDWPYNLFSMTHGRDRARVRGRARGDLERDGPDGVHGAVLDARVQEDPRQLLHRRARAVGERPRRARRDGLMPALRLQHTSVQVPRSELARCEAFYREVFGVRQVENLAGIAWFELPNGDHIHLVEGEPQAASSQAHLALHVDDFEETLERASAHGSPIIDAPDLWGAPRRFLRDPVGNLIEVFPAPAAAACPRPRPARSRSRSMRASAASMRPRLMRADASSRARNSAFACARMFICRSESVVCCSRSAWRFCASRISGAAYAACVEKARLSRMNG